MLKKKKRNMARYNALSTYREKRSEPSREKWRQFFPQVLKRLATYTI
jgi:hypothetical protein